MNDDQIKQMVNRFLAWRLPDDFAPDAGITFKPEFNEGTAHPMRHQPVGTNLLTYQQAEAMVRCITVDIAPLLLENARLKLHLEGERKLNTQLSTTNGKLSGAVEMAAPVSINAGSWFYPEGDTSSDECRFSPSEVVDNYAEGLRDGTKGVCVIERAVSLPDIYAAVRVLTDEERDELGEDESHVYTLHATLAEAQAALEAGSATASDLAQVAA